MGTLNRNSDEPPSQNFNCHVRRLGRGDIDSCHSPLPTARRRQAYIAELKAKGEPMELAQVVPPPVPPELNGVPFITNAFTHLKYESIAGSNTPPAMRMVAPGKAMIGWHQPDIRDFDGTNKWEDLGRELVTAKSELASFQSLTNHPVLDFNLEYQKGFDLQLPNLSSLKRSAQWLNTSALYDLHQGNTRSACADVRAMLALVKGETDERILISQLVRIAIAAIGASANWEILQDTECLERQLGAVAARLAIAAIYCTA